MHERQLRKLLNIYVRNCYVACLPYVKMAMEGGGVWRLTLVKSQNDLTPLVT